MGETLDIRQTGNELTIQVPSQPVWPLFRTRIAPPAIAFTVLALLALWAGWGIGLEWTDLAPVVGGYYAATLGVLGAALYFDVRPLTTSARLEAGPEGVRLICEERGIDRRIPPDDVQMLQVSEVALRREILEVHDKPFGELGEYELTLLTNSEMTVVGRGLERREAEEAVERFERVMST